MSTKQITFKNKVIRKYLVAKAKYMEDIKEPMAIMDKNDVRLAELKEEIENISAENLKQDKKAGKLQEKLQNKFKKPAIKEMRKIEISNRDTEYQMLGNLKLVDDNQIEGTMTDMLVMATDQAREKLDKQNTEIDEKLGM